MTLNKMKQFKKDRLQTNDRERMLQLSDLLKKVRQNENQIVQQCPEPSSPAKLAANPTISPRGISPSSPIKQQQITRTGFNFIQIQKGENPQQQQQIMTQITSIVNKRSRSTNNQAGNTNSNINQVNKEVLRNQVAAEIPEGFTQAQDRGKSPPVQQQQQVRKNSGNQAALENQNNKSPRVTRLKNQSPPSREKFQP